MPVSALWRYVHPDATAIAGFEWNEIARSPAGEFLRDRLRESPADVYLDGAESVVISSPGMGPACGSLPPFVAAVRGRLSHDRLRALALYSQPGEVELLIAPAWIVALLDAETILVGDLESVKSVLEWKPALPPPVAERAARVAPHACAWLLTSASPAWFFHSGNCWCEALAGVDRVEAAVAVREGLLFELHLIMPDAQSAAGLATSAAGAAGLLMAEGSGGSGLREAIEHLSVFSDGAKARIELSLTPEQFARAIEALAASPARSLMHLGDAPVPCRRLMEGMASSFDTGVPLADNGIVSV